MSTVPNQPGERTSRGASHLLVSEVPTEALIACGASLFWGGSIPRILTPAAGDAKLSDGVNASITNTQNISQKIAQNNFPNHSECFLIFPASHESQPMIFSFGNTRVAIPFRWNICST